jgi:hypothetical protein
MRGLLVTTAVALVLSAPTVAAAPEPSGCAAATSGALCFLPAPAGWVQVPIGWHHCQQCQEWGERGIDEGWWSEYHCAGRPIGLDYFYDVWHPPAG